jgi:sugar phosphate isomerase/epimerase
MKIKYLCPFWGSETIGPEVFVERVMEAGFDGVEINLPDNEDHQKKIVKYLNDNRLLFVAQQYLPSLNEDFATYRRRYIRRLEELAALGPLFINSHTGKDFWSFAQNCQLIEDAFLIQESTGVPVYHETHRGRFTFHPAQLLQFLDRYPALKITADFSHWCAVSESFLEDQRPSLERAIQHTGHIHARVGHTQSPQVTDPFVPEWEAALHTFVNWWQEIIQFNSSQGNTQMCICPEFGPAPYMPSLPYTNQPVNNQWLLNVKMKDFLRRELFVF